MVETTHSANELLDWLAGRCDLELSYGPVDGDLSDCSWCVHSVTGGYNDREWKLVATGGTPADALRATLTTTENRGRA